MVRAAKLSGNGASLYPDGISSIEDMPWDIAQAIEWALRVISWEENLLSEDMPPHWMLAFDEELTEWFEEIKIKREMESGGTGEQVPTVENEFAERFKR